MSGFEGVNPALLEQWRRVMAMSPPPPAGYLTLTQLSEATRTPISTLTSRIKMLLATKGCDRVRATIVDPSGRRRATWVYRLSRQGGA
jgi:hypothetical protein